MNSRPLKHSLCLMCRGWEEFWQKVTKPVGPWQASVEGAASTTAVALLRYVALGAVCEMSSGIRVIASVRLQNWKIVQSVNGRAVAAR